MTIQLLDDAILLDSGAIANHEDCCCGVDCGRCSFVDKPESWVVDLGAGGWVDDDCDYCDQIAGQFTLDYLSDCKWQYLAESVCTFVFNYDLAIDLRYEETGGSDWRWWLQVDLRHPAVSSVALYRSATSSNADCFNLGGEDSLNKITLNKFNEFHINSGSVFSCSGTLDDPIEIWVP